MDDFDAYAAHYLAQWDKRATVRGMPRHRLPSDGGGSVKFPLHLTPIARHPRVQAMGAEAVDFLLRAFAIEWQAEVAHLEVAVVADLCGRVAVGGFGFPLPSAARQVALTIATDEMYHAFVAREYLANMTGHADMHAPESAASEAIALIRDTADPRFVAEAEVMALCFFENFVTEELLGLSRHDGNPSPFHIIMREHLIDEGRHQRYFTLLMTHMWAHASPACREALAAVLPPFLDILLRNPHAQRDRIVPLLAQLGLDAGTCDEIHCQTLQTRGPVVPKFARASSVNTMKLITAAGLDRDAISHAALARAGWLPEAMAT